MKKKQKKKRQRQKRQRDEEVHSTKGKNEKRREEKKGGKKEGRLCSLRLLEREEFFSVTFLLSSIPERRKEDEKKTKRWFEIESLCRQGKENEAIDSLKIRGNGERQFDVLDSNSLME